MVLSCWNLTNEKFVSLLYSKGVRGGSTKNLDKWIGVFLLLSSFDVVVLSADNCESEWTRAEYHFFWKWQRSTRRDVLCLFPKLWSLVSLVSILEWRMPVLSSHMKCILTHAKIHLCTLIWFEDSRWMLGLKHPSKSTYRETLKVSFYYTGWKEQFLYTTFET